MAGFAYSLAGSSRGSAVSVASSGAAAKNVVGGVGGGGGGGGVGERPGASTPTASVGAAAASDAATVASTQSLDHQLRALDRFYQNKVSPVLVFFLINLPLTPLNLAFLFSDFVCVCVSSSH